MDLKDFYKKIDGNYDDAKNRLMTEDLMMRFINKFANSRDKELMIQAIEKEAWEDAFRYSHNIKGVCLNLGFTKLAKSACNLCETMRNGKPAQDNKDLLNEVITEYNNVIELINNI